MSKRKKETRFFTQIFDDVLRSPNLKSHDVRLYGIMLSYCMKGSNGSERVCKLPKKVLAAQMKISERTVYNALRNLQKAGLIRIEYVDNDHRLPIYVMVDDPPIQCPEGLRTNKLKDAMDYVHDAGGVRSLQRRSYKARKKTKRVGRPDSFTNGFELVDPDDDSTDDLSPEAIEEVSPADSPTGTQMPVDWYPDASSTGTQMPVDSQPVTSRLVPRCQSTGTQMPPSTYKNREQSRERPNGLEPQAHYRALVPPPLPPRRPAEPTTKPEMKMSVRRAAQAETPQQEVATMAKPTKEEMEAARARQKALRKGTRTKIADVAIPEGKSKGSTGGSQKPRRGAGGPAAGKDDTQAVMEKHITADPDAVSQVPDKPWPLYAHFCKAVRKKYPDARLPSAANGKYLKWGKILLKDYSTSDIYEMIRVLVLDYQNISTSRIFFKFAGTPTPTYEQFFSNRDTLATFIGTGIIAPPSVRFSHYADDYNRRHGKSADINPDSGDPGKTGDDPLEALRDQVNG